MRALAFLLLATLLTFAGCLEGEGTPPAAEPEPDERTSAGANLDAPMQAAFGWDAAVGVPTTGMDAQLSAANGVSMDIPAGQDALVVDVAWSCTSPSCDLHLYLCSPDERPTPPVQACSAHEMGSSPVQFRVEGPAEGEWLLVLHSDSLSMGVDGLATFTVELAGDASAAAT